MTIEEIKTTVNENDVEKLRELSREAKNVMAYYKVLEASKHEMFVLSDQMFWFGVGSEEARDKLFEDREQLRKRIHVCEFMLSYFLDTNSMMARIFKMPTPTDNEIKLYVECVNDYRNK